MVSLWNHRISILVLALLLSLPSVSVASGAGPATSAFLSPHGSCGSDQITSIPAAPTFRDPIQITVSGVWCNGCAPKYQSHELSGPVITIYGHSAESDPGVACIQALTSWAFAVEVGPLPAGAYSVRAIVHQRVLSSLSLQITGTRNFLPLLLN
jgi:hypothetical protein